MNGFSTLNWLAVILPTFEFFALGAIGDAPLASSKI